MKLETIAIHGGYEVEATTKAVAVPIYQTVAYAFDSAEHAAALFNLEAEGFRYTRIQNPKTAVLERRVAALEAGSKPCVSQRSGGGELRDPERRRVRQQHCIRPWAVRHHAYVFRISCQPGNKVSFAASDDPQAITRRIDNDTRAVCC